MSLSMCMWANGRLYQSRSSSTGRNEVTRRKVQRTFYSNRDCICGEQLVVLKVLKRRRLQSSNKLTQRPSSAWVVNTSYTHDMQSSRRHVHNFALRHVEGVLLIFIYKFIDQFYTTCNFTPFHMPSNGTSVANNCTTKNEKTRWSSTTTNADSLCVMHAAIDSVSLASFILSQEMITRWNTLNYEYKSSFI